MSTCRIMLHLLLRPLTLTVPRTLYFRISIPLPICTQTRWSRQEVSNSWRNYIKMNASSNSVITACQPLLVLCEPPLACVSTQLNWSYLCALFFQKDLRIERFCVNLSTSCRNYCTHTVFDTQTSSHQATCLLRGNGALSGN